MRELGKNTLVINQEQALNQSLTFNHELSFQIVPSESILSNQSHYIAIIASQYQIKTSPAPRKVNPYLLNKAGLLSSAQRDLLKLQIQPSKLQEFECQLNIQSLPSQPKMENLTPRKEFKISHLLVAAPMAP